MADHVASLGMVAVKPGLAGRGIARQMMVEAIEGLRAAGVRRVDLNVETGNARAIVFYQRLGFEIEGTLRRGFSSSGGQIVDDHVMSLLLDRDATTRPRAETMTTARNELGLDALRIRRARREDVPRIVALLADDPLGAGREPALDPLPRAYCDAFEAIDAAPHEDLAVAELDGRIVGCLQLTVLRTLSRAGAKRALVEGRPVCAVAASASA